MNRTDSQNQAKQCFEGQEAGRALKMLDDAVNEAKDYKKSGGGRRADAWRSVYRCLWMPLQK